MRCAVLDDPPCSVAALRDNPEGYYWPIESITGFVSEADLIVRAVPSTVAPSQEGGTYWSEVGFRVVEVLKGDTDTEEVLLPGIIVDGDELRSDPVPYRIVRGSGQRGSCHTLEYRMGAEYLLVMKEIQGAPSPHRAPLAPHNEQVRGEQDPWVSWVRSQLGWPDPAAG